MRKYFTKERYYRSYTDCGCWFAPGRFLLYARQDAETRSISE